jgi:T-complex protein 1 subunit epsilon
MKEHFVIDPLIGKRQQLLLATQLCRMVLKVSWMDPTPAPSLHSPNLRQINNVIISGDDEQEF